MGCALCKPETSDKETQVEKCADTEQEPQVDKCADTEPLQVEIYGLAGSLNTIGAVLLVHDKNIGALVPTPLGLAGTSKPEYLTMNPFGQMPTMKDPKTGIITAESCSMLRYLATRYAPELYPSDPKRAAYIDWAMELFAELLMLEVWGTIYPIWGLEMLAPANKAAFGKAASEHLDEYAKFFLREKFIGGSKPSIADYRVAPFFFAFAHPVLKSKACVECPNRIKQFVNDFLVECPSHDMLYSACGWGVQEMLDDALGSVAGQIKVNLPEKVEVGDLLEGKEANTGKTQLYGNELSLHALGALICGLDLKVAELVRTNTIQNIKNAEFLAMNPFKIPSASVPTMKDGDFALGGCTAILRYYARTYKPELYPPDKQAHIDWACDNFATNGLYLVGVQSIYHCLGIHPFRGDVKALCNELNGLAGKLRQYAEAFLKDKFVGGDELSIADYKIAPFFYAWGHPTLKSKCGVD